MRASGGDAGRREDAGDAISAFSRKTYVNRRRFTVRVFFENIGLAKSFPSIGAAKWVKGFFASKKALSVELVFIKCRTQP